MKKLYYVLQDDPPAMAWLDLVSSRLSTLHKREGPRPLLITRLTIPDTMRGKGVARTLLRNICADADVEDVTLCLSSLAFWPYEGTDPARLQKLYRELGFAPSMHTPDLWSRAVQRDLTRHRLLRYTELVHWHTLLNWRTK